MITQLSDRFAHVQLKDILPKLQPDNDFFTKIEERIQHHHDLYQRVSPAYWAEIREFGTTPSSKDSFKYKARPYVDWNSLMEIQYLGHLLRHDSTAAITILENFTSYAIGKGMTFSVKPTPKYRERAGVKKLARDCQYMLDRFLSDNNWPLVQEEALKDRLLSSGDLIRRYEKSGPDLSWGWIDSHELESKTHQPFGIKYRGADPANGKMGDYRFPESYNILGEDIEAKEIQHITNGVDSKDPRGVPIMWMGFCSAKEIDELDYAAARAAIQYCKHTINYEWDPDIELAKIEEIAKGITQIDVMATELGKLNAGGSVHHAKGYTVSGLASEWSAEGFIQLIDFKMRMLGNITSQPEYLSTGKVDTGGRNNLISAESSITRRVERVGQKLAGFDIDLFYEYLSVRFGKWKQEDWMREFKEKIQITAKPNTPDGRDSIEVDRLTMEKMERGYTGKMTGIRSMGGDPYQIVEEDREWAELKKGLIDETRKERSANALYDEADLNARIATAQSLIAIHYTVDEALELAGLDQMEDQSELRRALEHKEELQNQLLNPEAGPETGNKNGNAGNTGGNAGSKKAGNDMENFDDPKDGPNDAPPK